MKYNKINYLVNNFKKLYQENDLFFLITVLDKKDFLSQLLPLNLSYSTLVKINKNLIKFFFPFTFSTKNVYLLTIKQINNDWFKFLIDYKFIIIKYYNNFYYYNEFLTLYKKLKINNNLICYKLLKHFEKSDFSPILNRLLIVKHDCWSKIKNLNINCRLKLLNTLKCKFNINKLIKLIKLIKKINV